VFAEKITEVKEEKYKKSFFENLEHPEDPSRISFLIGHPNHSEKQVSRKYYQFFER
jgi:hypothetical protein